MNKLIFAIMTLASGCLAFTSCQNESIEHIGSTRLVILQKIPMAEKKFDENFKAALELLYPYECHDTVFIQEQIFLERIDLTVPCKKEFVVAPSLLRDFFGSNNPDKKRALREDLIYFSDSSFEANPDRHFLIESQLRNSELRKAIGEYLSRNRKNAMVYLISNDTLHKSFGTDGVSRTIYSDFVKLNCRIVADLRKKSREELINTSVILIMIPPEVPDTTEKNAVIAQPYDLPGQHPVAMTKKKGACPPDSTVTRINKTYTAIITEFRNLLHYIATTNDDSDLKRKYKDDAFAGIHQIPKVKIEGIPCNDLGKFLNSGFSSYVMVSPVTDHCQVICGIRISGQGAGF